MTLYLQVEVDQLEEGADFELVRERAEEALKKAFPYNDTSVTVDEYQ